jgi:hypothetical protein
VSLGHVEWERAVTSEDREELMRHVVKRLVQMAKAQATSEPQLG